MGAVEQLGMAIVQERCVAVRNRNVPCETCVKACPVGCIALGDDGLMAIDAAACVGCGACTTVCPTEAVQARALCDAEVVRRAVAAASCADGRAVVACSTAFAAVADEADARKVAQVPCLAFVSAEALVELATRGVGRATLVCGTCADCACAVGAERADRAIARAQELLEACGCAGAKLKVSRKFPSAVRLGADAPVADEGAPAGGSAGAADGAWVGDASRDAARASAGTAGAGRDAACASAGGAGTNRDAVGTSLVERRPFSLRLLRVGANGTLPRYPSDRRERLLNNLWRMRANAADGCAADDARVVAPTLQTGVEIDADQCSSCRMCAKFCPTGALTLAGDGSNDEPFGVSYLAAACVGCMTCQNVCPIQALRLTFGDDLDEVLRGEPCFCEMTPPSYQAGKPDSILRAMRRFMLTDKVSAR